MEDYPALKQKPQTTGIEQDREEREGDREIWPNFTAIRPGLLVNCGPEPACGSDVRTFPNFPTFLFKNIPAYSTRIVSERPWSGSCSMAEKAATTGAARRTLARS